MLKVFCRTFTKKTIKKKRTESPVSTTYLQYIDIELNVVQNLGTFFGCEWIVSSCLFFFSCIHNTLCTAYTHHLVTAAKSFFFCFVFVIIANDHYHFFSLSLPVESIILWQARVARFRIHYTSLADTFHAHIFLLKLVFFANHFLLFVTVFVL